MYPCCTYDPDLFFLFMTGDDSPEPIPEHDILTTAIVTLASAVFLGLLVSVS